MRTQRGFTLLELLLVIGLSTVIAGVVARSYLAQQSGADGEAMYTRVAQLRGAVQSVYPGRQYTGLTSAIMAAQPVTPTALISGTTLLDSVGGTITLSASTENGTQVADNAFFVQYSALPRQHCVSFVQRVANETEYFRLGSTVLIDVYNNVYFVRATVTTACSAAQSQAVVMRFKE